MMEGRPLPGRRVWQTTMNRLLLGLFALAACLQGALSSTTIETDNDVLVLTDANFDQAIQEHDLLLVEFYAPWCGHCKKLEPEYAKAAGELKAMDPPLYIAKVDAAEYKDLGQKYEVKGFPTIKLFKAGTPLEYSGGRTAEAIVEYMVKKSGPAMTALASVGDAEAFLAKHAKAAIGFFPEGLEAGVGQGFKSYADKFDSLPLGYTTAKDVMDKYKAKKDQVHFFTPEGTFSTTPDFTKEEADVAFGSWLFGHSIAPLFKFSMERSMELFTGPIRVHALLFADSEASDYPKVAAAVKDAAIKYRTQALSVEVPKNESRILEAFDLKETDVPKLVLADMRGGAMKRFLYEGDVKNSGKMGKFIGEFFDGKLKPKLKSEEPAPEDMAGPVKVIKGKSFQKEVLDAKKDVLLEFYAPWCGHCKNLEPKYNTLGEKFVGVDHVMVAKIDFPANEIEHPAVNIKGFPTILFFPDGKKDAPIPFEGPREVNAMIDFIQEHATKPFTVEKEPELELAEEGEEVQDEL